MPCELYRSSFAEAKRDAITEAIHKAKAVPEETILSRSVEEISEEIAETRMVFARLKPEERRGKRLGNKIEVTVPFDGWPKSLTIAPSTCIEIRTSAKYSPNGLQATFPDDDALDGNVDRFIRDVGINLVNLQKEWPNIKEAAKTSVAQVLEVRKKTIQERIARDRSRSFPIE